MKKTIIFFALALSALTVLSCTVKDDGGDIATSGRTIFTANLEALNFGAPETIAWNEGDAIGVFGTKTGRNERYLLRRSFAGTATAEFYGPVVDGDRIASYYPYNPALASTDGQLSINIPSDQPYSPGIAAGTFFRSVVDEAFAWNEGGVLNFCWPCGILRLSLDIAEAVEISGATLSAEGCPLSGRMTVGEGCTLSPVTGSAPERVSLDLGGETFASREGDVCADLLFVLPAGSYDNLVLTLDAADGTSLVLKVSSVEVRRVESADYILASASVGSDIPALEVGDGYLEQN